VCIFEFFIIWVCVRVGYAKCLSVCLGFVLLACVHVWVFECMIVCIIVLWVL